MLELDAAHLWLAVAVLLGFSVQTALGFGGGLLSMALAAQWMPIQAIVPLLVPLSVAQSIAVLATERQHVAWRPLLRLVVPAMSVGLVVGLWLATLLAEHDPLMRRVYGGLVIALALPGVWPRSSAAPRSSAPRRARAAMASVISGIVHGLFATGGPPLAYAAHCLGLERDAFRTTLMSTFLGINVVMVIVMVAQGRLRAEQAPALTVLIAAVVIAVPLGRAMARRLPEATFRRAVYGMLLLIGVSLLA